jgi:hypothetical protein
MLQISLDLNLEVKEFLFSYAFVCNTNLSRTTILSFQKLTYYFR